ncbi:MAG TPA: tetratricopeptide repeat protein [Pyrinomonadaceae bacterium]|jgi:tetratricopeptide (TPR) repeat protein
MLRRARHPHLSKTLSLLALFGLLLSGVTTLGATGQQTGAYESERERAFQLYEEGKHLEALPILEKLAEANPSDGPVLQELAFSLITYSATLPDKEARKKIRARARSIFVRAVNLNYNVEVLQPMIAVIPPDGGETDFSANKQAETAMREGESAFAQTKYDQALAAYQRAMQIEPKLYEAPLFIADVYFLRKQWNQAAEWYAKAIAIDPNRETAYRYWSDALLKEGKMAASRIKAIEAIIAEPYNQRAWVGLIQWAQVNSVKLAHPRIAPPNEEADTNFVIDPQALKSEDGSMNWTLYKKERAGWNEKRFAREFPKEKVYRHSLLEEALALRAVAEAASKDLKTGKVKALDPALTTLVKLNEDGLLEAYILLARADEGIAQDYEAYRAANRDKLKRYLAEYVAQYSLKDTV